MQSWKKCKQIADIFSLVEKIVRLSHKLNRGMKKGFYSIILLCINLYTHIVKFHANRRRKFEYSRKYMRAKFKNLKKESTQKALCLKFTESWLSFRFFVCSTVLTNVLLKFILSNDHVLLTKFLQIISKMEALPIRFYCLANFKTRRRGFVLKLPE